MSPMHSLLLPRADRWLLAAAVRVVPAAGRADWRRSWQAELWHRHHRRGGVCEPAVDLYAGLVRDAMWVRTHAWRVALTGTALLCIFLLVWLLAASLLPLADALGSVGAAFSFLCQEPLLFLCEAVPVAMVGFLISSRTIQYESGPGHRGPFRRRLFHLTKLVLVLLIAFLWSEDATVPFLLSHRFTAEVLQPLLFVLPALLGLRWSFDDHASRCRHCLRSLGAPARVGPPSRNFLDSNGTELLCREGHGLLSVPEIETSWRRSSRWIPA